MSEWTYLACGWCGNLIARFQMQENADSYCSITLTGELPTGGTLPCPLCGHDAQGIKNLLLLRRFKPWLWLKYVYHQWRDRSPATRYRLKFLCNEEQGIGFGTVLFECTNTPQEAASLHWTLACETHGVGLYGSPGEIMVVRT